MRHIKLFAALKIIAAIGLTLNGFITDNNYYFQAAVLMLASILDFVAMTLRGKHQRLIEILLPVQAMIFMVGQAVFALFPSYEDSVKYRPVLIFEQVSLQEYLYLIFALTLSPSYKYTLAIYTPIYLGATSYF